MTKVACKASIGGFVSIDRRSCLFKCNKEVTVYVDIQAEALCLYKSNGSQVYLQA